MPSISSPPVSALSAPGLKIAFPLAKEAAATMAAVITAADMPVAVKHPNGLLRFKAAP
jgi:hypothetical protein